MVSGVNDLSCRPGVVHPHETSRPTAASCLALVRSYEPTRVKLPRPTSRNQLSNESLGSMTDEEFDPTGRGLARFHSHHVDANSSKRKVQLHHACGWNTEIPERNEHLGIGGGVFDIAGAHPVSGPASFPKHPKQLACKRLG